MLSEHEATENSITVAELKKIEDNVAYLLRNYHSTRDSDRELFLKYWQIYNGMDSIWGMSEFRDWFVKDAENPETISRCRRKLQKANEDMRGSEYYLRHYEAAKMRREIVHVDMNKQPKLF